MSDEDRAKTPEENFLHETRVQIDKVIKIVGEIKAKEEYRPAGRELALSFTKLEEAKMWVGKALGAIGSYLPPEYRDEAK